MKDFVAEDFQKIEYKWDYRIPKTSKMVNRAKTMGLDGGSKKSYESVVQSR